MKLLDDEALEKTAVVANCRMNRERRLFGSNGYDRELGFDPVAFLKEKTSVGGGAAWLDLCCGTGRALIEAAEVFRAEGRAVEVVGVDLVGMFDAVPPALAGLRLVEASLSVWRPDRAFDLVTCVHGLHYVGDKLGLIARAVSWLEEDGLFVASLDLRNVRIGGDSSAPRSASVLRRAGLQYDTRRRLVSRRGRTQVNLPCRYLGADDTAGPNSTGQPAVDSHYAAVEGARR